MDPFTGIEVGAEVELNDGTLAVEDHTPITVENKRDLPLWHHVHYFEDSSSDESLDHQYVNTTPSEVKTLKMPSHVIDIKSQVVENDQTEQNIYVLSTTANMQPGHFYINGERRDHQSLVLNNAYSRNLQEHDFQLAHYFEESDISCTEVISSSDFGQLQTYSTEVYTETTLSHEEDPRDSLGKYSYFDTRTQCNKSVHPLGRSYKCHRCGRQFGRLYNLENHMCIKMAIGVPQQNSNNIETINSLEKMCAEAQKELQSLQGQYRKGSGGAQAGSSKILPWSQELLSGAGRVIAENKCAVPCDHQECQSRSIGGQEFHIFCNNNTNSFAAQNLTALGNTIVFDLTSCSPIFPETSQEQDSARQMEDIHPQLDQINGELTYLNQHWSFQAIEENPVNTTNTSHEATKMYKCQECGKVYNRHSSVANHMRWHRNEKKFISSVVNALVEPAPGDDEFYGTTHHVRTLPLDRNKVSCAKPTEMFTCEYCGKVFNKHCSYATHTLWHLKNKEPVAVISTQGANQETGQVSESLPIKKPKSDRACDGPVKVFTCQICGRIFNKRCAYASHNRWHMKMQKLQKGVTAKAQRVIVDKEDLMEGDFKNALKQDNVVSDLDPNKGLSDSCLDYGNVKGYCRLVSQLSLDEQNNLSSCQQVGKKCNEPSYPLLAMQVEPNQPRSPEVLESVLELVVGTEEVHEILLSKAGHVFRKAEDYGVVKEVKDVAQVSEMELKQEKPVPAAHSEPVENQEPGMQLEAAEKPVSGVKSEPAEEQIRVMPLEAAEKQVLGTWSETEEIEVLGTPPEPAQKPVPGRHSQPVEKQVSEPQTEPAKKPYPLPVLPSKLVVQCLSRPKPPHRCRDCGIHFYHSWRLQRHRLKDFGKRCTLTKHQCDCGRIPIGSLHFLLHQLQHLSDTTFTCAVCSKSLRGFCQLQAHSWVHPLVSQFQCKCGIRFTKLPKYLWHSLRNKAKPRPKLHLRGCAGAPLL